MLSTLPIKAGILSWRISGMSPNISLKGFEEDPIIIHI